MELGSGNRAITSPQYGYSNGLRHESADAANPNLDDHIDLALSTHDSSFTEIHAAGHHWTPTIQAPDEPPVATYFEAPNTVTSTATLSSGSNQQVSRHAGDYEQAGTSTLPWSDSPVFLKCGESLELLKYYRYNVAPWVKVSKFLNYAYALTFCSLIYVIVNSILAYVWLQLRRAMLPFEQPYQQFPKPLRVRIEIPEKRMCNRTGRRKQY